MSEPDICHGTYEHVSGHRTTMHTFKEGDGCDYADRCPRCSALVRVDWDNEANAWQVMPHDPKGA